ncbi:DUF742 domain-containing protein [Streptomyces scopuliridis]|uniref:DUF742 domain-containing protein n=1 Tax=Streptomyces scopuliridis TaxID=452529 RepID=A0ACD4ZV95_9ACTN|nr:DUF742 domain-containing protein [Streptomyces scopuliridis]WSC01708.1 DUF742 domain-containing protein [Streptomyces scopuliridis]WSC04753.1 DUF742 domain-containing protein [Streptomyces scopuliridis]
MADAPAPWDVVDQEYLRPYMVTGGRTDPSHAMGLGSLLKARANGASRPLNPEEQQVLVLCQGGPRSVAEVAGRLRQPVQVTKILLSDLLECGALIMAMPTTYTDARDPQFLEAVLDGLRKKFAG